MSECLNINYAKARHMCVWYLNIFSHLHVYMVCACVSAFLHVGRQDWHQKFSVIILCMIYWGRVCHLSPELTDGTANLASLLSWGNPCPYLLSTGMVDGPPGPAHMCMASGDSNSSSHASLMGIEPGNFFPRLGPKHFQSHRRLSYRRFTQEAARELVWWEAPLGVDGRFTLSSGNSSFYICSKIFNFLFIHLIFSLTLKISHRGKGFDVFWLCNCF